MEKNGKPKVRVAKILQKLHVLVPSDKEAEKLFPTLCELMKPQYEGGRCVRQPGRLTVKPDGSLWRVSIECPTEQRQASTVLPSLVTLLQDFEKYVTSPACHFGLTWALQKKNLPVLDDAIE